MPPPRNVRTERDTAFGFEKFTKSSGEVPDHEERKNTSAGPSGLESLDPGMRSRVEAALKVLKESKKKSKKKKSKKEKKDKYESTSKKKKREKERKKKKRRNSSDSSGDSSSSSGNSD